MHYTIHQLQVFCKVVQTRSITKAAAELFLTQPGVSIQLKNFQDQFDIPLTEVVGRQLFVTEFGQEIAALAADILERMEAINYKAAAFKGIHSGRLKIAVVSTGKYVMPYFLSDFLNQNQGVDLLMDVTNKQSVLKSLENNEVDFGLVSVLPDKLKVEQVLLLDNILHLVGSRESDLTAQTQPADLLSGLPLIYREEGSATRLIMERYLEAMGIGIRKKLELTSNEAVKQAVIAGLGYSVMPLIGIRNEIKSGELQIIPVKGLPICTEWRLIWLSQKRLSPVAEAYLAYLDQHKASIVQQKFGWIDAVVG